jgi:hypothetical protein
MTFSMKLTPRVESVLWGAAGGAVGLAVIGFAFGGWVTGGKAAEMARQQADKAVVSALAPICVDKFRHASNASENLGKLNAINSSWEQGTYVSQGGWATLPGNSEPNSGVAQACAELLKTLAK